MGKAAATYEVTYIGTLIARAEAARRTDWELSSDIAEVCGATLNPKNRAYGRWSREEGCKGYYSLPNLIASIDEAVAVVERVRPGWQWVLKRWGPADGGVTAFLGEGQHEVGGIGVNPALALLAALLRSLEQEAMSSTKGLAAALSQSQSEEQTHGA